MPTNHLSYISLLDIFIFNLIQAISCYIRKQVVLWNIHKESNITWFHLLTKVTTYQNTTYYSFLRYVVMSYSVHPNQSRN